MPIHPDYKSEYQAMIKKYGPEKGKSVFYATMKKQGLDYKKPRPGKKSSKEIKHSFLNGLSVKESEEDNLIIEGFVATSHVDNTHLSGEGRLDDMIPEGTLDNIARQINTNSLANKLSLHHRDLSPESPVAGVMKNAEVRDTDDGHKGVWVEATINKVHPKYESIKSEVEQGMIDGFSIEYETLQSHPQLIGDKEVRVLDNLLIGGVGLASKPLNPNAQIKNHTYKELLKFKTKEVSKMKETKEKDIEDPKEKVPAEEKPVEEPKPEVDSDPKPEEEPKEEPKEEPSEEKEFKEFKEMKRKTVEKEALMLNMKEAFKDMEPKDMPRFQGGMQFKEKEVKEAKALVDSYKKTSLECKEWSPIVNANKDDGTPMRTKSIDLQFKEAAKLHDQLDLAMKEQGKPGLGLGKVRYGEDIRCDMSTQAGLASPSLEVKESHWKGLEIKANPLTTTTSQISAATHYIAAAELADVYDPVIYNMLNDKTTFYGLLRKVDASKYSYAYEWRAIYGRQTVAGYLAEGATAITPDSTDRIILRQPFKFHYAAVRVTGPMEAASKGRDTIGNIMAVEVKDATRAFLVNVNSKLLVGVEDGSNDGDEAMGLTYVVDDGTTYTDMYIGVSRNTYKLEGNSESASSANITKGRLRKGIRACESGDTNLQANNAGLYSSADKADLIIVTHPLQKDKILALFDDAQRFNTVSAKAGFEGMATFDGIPIHPDRQCTSSVLFIVDMRHTFLAVQVPPTLTAWGQEYNYDLSSGFIKTYHNLVCTKPGNNYKVTSLATT